MDTQPAPLPDNSKPTVAPPKHRWLQRFKPKMLIFATAGLVLLAIGLVAWKFTGSKQSADNAERTAPASQTNSGVDSDVPQATDIKQYENGFLGLNLAYPATWTATEPESKDAVRLESPEFNYKTANGEQTAGNFRVYIRKGAREADSKYIGRGLAIKPSEKITYSQPVAGQRTETLISSFGLDSTDNFAFFLIAGNFQLNTGESLGPTYGKELETYIIAGGYSSKDLNDDLATHPVPTANYDQTNAYKQAVEIIKSLQLH
jgi:hypothetical protein